MCGITGSLNLNSYGYSVPASKVQFDMMLTSMLRGVDSTGLLFGDMDLDKPVQYSRSIKTAADIHTRAGMLSYMRNARWMVTHVRSATVGDIDEDGCHPFIEDKVMGVHNGSVYDYDTLFPKHLGVNDSHTIYKALAAEEPENATAILSQLSSGAYALVWYDARIQSLRFARNADRPLWFHKEESYWWWNSEPGQIAACIARASRDPLSYSTIVPWQLDTHKLLTIPVNGSPASVQEYIPAPISYFTGRGYTGCSSWGGYGSGKGGYDSWEDDVLWYDDLPSKGSGSMALLNPTGLEKKVPWYTIESVRDLRRSPSYLDPYINPIQDAIRRLFGTLLTPITTEEWEDGIMSVARRTGTTDHVPVVSFYAQDMSSVGLATGAINIPDWGIMPIAAYISTTTQAQARDDFVNMADDGVPMLQAEITGIKVYPDGQLGLFCKLASLMGYVPESEVTPELEAIGCCSNHPHIVGNLGATQSKDFDWSTWK